MFHGTKDRIVNCEGSVIVYNRLRETSHEAELYLLKDADQGGSEFRTDQMIELADRFCHDCFALSICQERRRY